MPPHCPPPGNTSCPSEGAWQQTNRSSVICFFQNNSPKHQITKGISNSHPTPPQPCFRTSPKHVFKKKNNPLRHISGGKILYVEGNSPGVCCCFKSSHYFQPLVFHSGCKSARVELRALRLQLRSSQLKDGVLPRQSAGSQDAGLNCAEASNSAPTDRAGGVRTAALRFSLLHGSCA